MNANTWSVSNLELFHWFFLNDCVADDQERFQTAIRCACELVKSDSVLKLATDGVTGLSLHNALPPTISLSTLMLKLPNLQVKIYKHISMPLIEVTNTARINLSIRISFVLCSDCISGTLEFVILSIN